MKKTWHLQSEQRVHLNNCFMPNPKQYDVIIHVMIEVSFVTYYALSFIYCWAVNHYSHQQDEPRTKALQHLKSLPTPHIKEGGKNCPKNGIYYIKKDHY